jgi:RNA polymerase sigma-70 factor, ECF subfamily
MLSEGTRSAHRELEQKLRPFVARRVPSADVDDVLQDVFVRVQRALPELRDDQSFGAWLYRVARSAVSENLRQRARHPLAGNGDVELESAAGEEHSESRDNGLAAYAAAAIARLPSPYREALTLTDLEGLTQLQAARMLGMSPSGMKSRVQRGRQKLRKLIDECCSIALDARGGVVDCEPRQPGVCECTKPREV